MKAKIVYLKECKSFMQFAKNNFSVALTFFTLSSLFRIFDLQELEYKRTTMHSEPKVKKMQYINNLSCMITSKAKIIVF